jgi:hypothetical protein
MAAIFFMFLPPSASPAALWPGGLMPDVGNHPEMSIDVSG